MNTLTRRIIPCLDVSNGRVVKGERFTSLRDAGDPVECACRYEEDSADELVFLDISATPIGRRLQYDVVSAVRSELSIPLTAGGGIRTLEDAERLLASGADKIAINTAAVLRPELITEIAKRFGNQCAVLAIDARKVAPDKWMVLTNGGREETGIDVIEWCREGVSRGAGEILLTSWDRDGTGEGYDEALLKEASSAISVPLIASGGGKTVGHFARALECGADAVLAASIFHFKETTVRKIKESLLSRGVNVRMTEAC